MLSRNTCWQLFAPISVPDPVHHEKSLEWLSSTAKSVVEKQVMPRQSNDPINALHCSLLYVGFLYTDLRKAIRYEEGDHIIHLWKYWAILSLGIIVKTTLLKLQAPMQFTTYQKHIAYIVTHKKIANLYSIPGQGKPIDQVCDVTSQHYNYIINHTLTSHSHS